MGIVPEEEKYSLGRTVRIEMKNFLKTKTAQSIEDNQDTRTIVRFFLECFYIYLDMPPKEMTGRDFREAVLEILPRRFTGKEKYLSQVPQVAAAYMEYLRSSTDLKDLPQIEKTLEELKKRFIKKVKSVKDTDRIQDEAPVSQIVREKVKLSRNDPCPCGSGKKYKKCCLGKEDG